MRNNFTVILILLTFFSCKSKYESSVDRNKIFILIGQSNMVGYGYNSELPDSLTRDFDNIYIYNSSSTIDNMNFRSSHWEKIAPGHGVDMSFTDNKYVLSDRFGIELSFAKSLRNKYKNSNIGLIKYAKGATILGEHENYDSWNPDSNITNQYDYLKLSINDALSNIDINNDGIKDEIEICGVLWLQGESDAKFENLAYAYEDNLQKFIKKLRSDFGLHKVPFLIGKVYSSKNENDDAFLKYIKIVNNAEELICNKNPFTFLVECHSDYAFCDKYHYTTKKYIELGNIYANFFNDK